MSDHFGTLCIKELIHNIVIQSELPVSASPCLIFYLFWDQGVSNAVNNDVSILIR